VFVILQSMARSDGYDMKSVRLTEDAILTIFDKLGNVKPKRISSLMEKLILGRISLRTLLYGFLVHSNVNRTQIGAFPLIYIFGQIA